MRKFVADSYQRGYRKRGYHVFRNAFDPNDIGSFANRVRTILPAYNGLIWRQSGDVEFNEFFYGTSLVKNSILNMHIVAPPGLESLSLELRKLITSQALGDRLKSLDGEDHYTIHQTILFLTAPTTDLHLDSWSLDTVPHGGAHTIWIPLQDMNPLSGVPSVVPWPKDMLLTEADLGLSGTGSSTERYDRYQCSLASTILQKSPEAITPLMRAGDFIVWSSLTPHFTLPSRPWPAERLAVQVLVRPTRRIWGSFANQPPKWTIDRSLRFTKQFSLLFN